MNLVFASGFFVPQAVLGKNYFRDLPQRYPDALFSMVSVVGSIAERAGELAAAMAEEDRPKRGPKRPKSPVGLGIGRRGRPKRTAWDCRREATPCQP